MMDVSKVSEDLLHEDDNLEEATMDIDVLTQKTRPQLQASKTKSALNYKSYQDLSLAIRNNFVKIPRDVDLVIGVPRSGMLPATMIAEILNKPVVALDSYIEGKLCDIGDYRRPMKLVTNISEVRKVLIVDDSINTGNSIKKAKERIRNSDKVNIDTVYCAVYYLQESAANIDIGFEECPMPRVFQWNILNSWVLPHACVDIDGVVCVDPTEDENDDGERYESFLRDAMPLFLTEFKIGSFVTSRLEKYRSLTEEWLQKHNLKYGELIMLDLPSKEERLKRNAHATFKAEVYRNRREDLFIESSLSQALQISKLTRKNVFCTENMQMITSEDKPLQNSVIPQKYEELLAGAEAAIQSRNLQKAQSALETILAGKPKDVAALNDLAVVRILTQDFSSAAQTIGAVLDIDPDNKVARGNLKILKNMLTQELTALKGVQRNSADCQQNTQSQSPPAISNEQIDDDYVLERFPLVSIIIPTYNRPDGLRETLASISKQTYKNLEVIVVNDAGKNVRGIADEFSATLKVKYFDHETNRRSGAARNTGIKAATGEYICYIDDDDVFYPDHVEILVKRLEQKNCAIGYTDAHRANQIKQAGKYVTLGVDVAYSQDFSREGMFVANFIPILCVMHKRSILDEVGVFDESLTSHIDWDLWVRMAMKYDFLHIKKVTCRFTWRHDGSTMTSCGQEDLRKTAAIIYLKHADYYAKIPGLVERQRKQLTDWIGDLRQQAQTLTAEGNVEGAISLLGRIVKLKSEVIKIAPHLNLNLEDDDRLQVQLLLQLAMKAMTDEMIGKAREACEAILLLDKNNVQASDMLDVLTTNKDSGDSVISNTKRISGEHRKSVSDNRVSIIIPVFNKVQFTQKCVETLYKNTDCMYLEIIIVDNGSTDGTEQYLSTLKGRIKIIRNEENLGFAKACNQGARASSGKYLVFLNNDTEPQPGWLEEMLKTANGEENVGIVGSKLIYPDGTIQHAGVVINKNKLPYHIYRKYPSNFVFANRQRDYQVVTAACMLIRRDLLFDVGCFDERYLNGYEDVDLCFKVGTQGKRVVYNPKSVVIHYESQSEGRQNKMGVNERLLLDTWANVIQQDDHLVFLQNGEELTKRGFAQGAKMYFDHASSLCPSQSEIINSRNPIVGELYARAQTMIGDGKYDEAKEILMKALVIEPLHPACLNDLAVLHSLGKEPNAAIEVLNCLLETDPENVVAGRNLARLYLQTGKIENALRSYLAVLKITTEDNDTLLAVAKVCISLDRLEDAKFFFNKVLMTSKDAVLKRRVMSQISELENRQCDEKAASMPIKDIMPGSAAGEVLSNCPDAPQQALADTGVTVSNPLVSIILLVYNKLEFSRRCIQSIFANVKYKNYEIVVTDNGSSDGTQEFMTDLVKRFEKIKYVRNQSNLGFVGGNNNGVAAASGKYIILLNNDTIVNEGWLESLVDLAVKTPDCGVVGSKLIYPDGRLQEAGGIIFSDGNGWNYGRWMNPDDPKYNFVREVDYVSGASLMVRRDLWEEIGGFDVRYSPAYYEDTDLCFAIRNLGYRVYYQPRSSVFHYEGVTSGTNLNEGFKKFQVINRPKFAEKWRAELMDQYPNDPRNVEKASSRGTVKRVLITSPSFPMFDRAAGSLYLFNIMKILRRMKFSVTFIAANPVLYESYQPFLRKLGIETYPGDQDAMNCFGYKGSCPKIDYERLFREREFDFALIDFWYQAEYYLPLIKKYSPSTTVIIDTEDVHFVRETREAEVKDDPEMKIRAAVNKRRELAIYRKADSLWVVTDEDKRALAHEIHDVPIDILPLIHELPEANHGFENRQGLLFVGNFNHTPNIDAVQFFVKDVLPKVAKFIPEVILYIVGNDPRNETAKLAGENVKAVGYVEDLSVYYDKCKVVVAPLRYGAGLKGKIVESLSYGVPVVTTSIGAEGTGLQDGEDIMVSDDPDEMAKRIAALYSNKETWERLSENGRIQMQSRWSVEAGQKRLEDILLNRTLETRGSEGKLTSIVILTYNQLEYTKLTIDSIRKYTKVPYEIIVVDNASSDGTVRYLKAQKDIRTIFNRENVGFPAGCNQGMELAKGDYIVLVNNDVIVPNDWLEGLIECAESNASIGVVGPMSNKISGFQMERNVKYKKINQMHEFAASYRRKYRKVWIEAQRVAGFCMLIKRTVLDKIGGLDVAFGMGNCEDDDFCVRSSLAGFKIVIAGDVFIHHFGSRSFGKDGLEKYKEFIKVNEDIFKEKWGVTPLEWWRERKNITKVSSLYVPLNIGEAVPVLSEGTFGGK